MASGTITLSIEVDAKGHAVLQDSGQKIVIVRAMSPAPDVAVACAVFPPFGPATDVEFEKDWAVFVMQGSPVTFSVVKMQITQPMQPGNECTFDGSGFRDEQPAYAPAVFGVSNEDSTGPLSVGLAQRMTIANADGWQPVAIQDFPYNETSWFEPTADVWVFVAKDIVVGELLPAGLLRPVDNVGVDAGGVAIAGPPSVGRYLVVPLTADTTIHFDDADNCFAPGPLP
jgi:hypothetical protein